MPSSLTLITPAGKSGPKNQTSKQGNPQAAIPGRGAIPKVVPMKPVKVNAPAPKISQGVSFPRPK